ncbi:MAG TPA: serine/threonine-protein kinase, partial [Polyangiaceae bacterium]
MGPDPNDIAAGTVLAGKYRLESLIGRGGMGSVWRAEHLGLNAPVAVKLLNLVHFDGASDALARFHREARSAAAIRSPHVVQILDHGVDSTFAVPFIVMELMEGESLANRLTRCGRIGPAEVGRIFAHVARALSRAHEAGIVHRDLKPDNVFLVVNEDEEVAKVLDFGIAKAQAHALAPDSNTRTGAIMGTAYYMSPEQISGTKNVDFRTDLWAMGVMACECLTGLRPFEADSIGGITLKICVEPVPLPSSLGPVPAGFDDWFAKIVHRDPAERFPSARAAADALRQLCNDEAGVRVISSPLPEQSGSLESSVAERAVSLSATAQALSDASVPKKKTSVAPWLVGGALLLASAAGLWLRTSTSRVAPDASPSASAPAAAASGAAPAAAATIAPAPLTTEPVPSALASSSPSAGLSASPPPLAVSTVRQRPAKRAAPASPRATTTSQPPVANAPGPAVPLAKPADPPPPNKPEPARD